MEKIIRQTCNIPPRHSEYIRTYNRRDGTRCGCFFPGQSVQGSTLLLVQQYDQQQVQMLGKLCNRERSKWEYVVVRENTRSLKGIKTTKIFKSFRSDYMDGKKSGMPLQYSLQPRECRANVFRVFRGRESVCMSDREKCFSASGRKS